MKVLVTGGAGFIGSHLATALVEAGHAVRVLDSFATGRPENLAHLEGRIELIESSITEPAAVAAAVEGVEIVFHQAALPSVARSVEDPVGSNAANVDGTLLVLVAARDAGVRRVIYAASSSAYGGNPALPKVETMTPAPLSPYAVAKLAGEMYCQSFHHVYGLETVCLRYFNVFGPRQDPHSHYSAVIPKFIDSLLRGEKITIFGDGEQSRDFTYVDNVVRGNLLAMDAPGAPGEVINLACGDRFTLNRLVRILAGLLGREPDVEYAPARPGDVRHSQADISKAARILGYTPVADFEEGLARTVEYFRGAAEAVR